MRQLSLIILLLVTLLVTGCHQRDRETCLSASSCDSVCSSSPMRHYSFNYNFVVKADSIILLRQQPEEKLSDLLTDSFVVTKNENVVVADIRIVPNDSIDSVWVQVATAEPSFGWIHETELLPNVVPDDPISQFISTFSDKHTFIFFIVITLIAMAYLYRVIIRRNAHIVHFNDIDSFYPTLLTLVVSLGAVVYATIQMFCPELWQHFYYHPTLNPFSVPFILSLFLILFWTMVIVGLAVVDDVHGQLPLGETVLYLCGLVGVCALDYIVFSISTLYYIGYILFVFYVIFALWQYFKYRHSYYLCGHCGAKIYKKGRCPHCGATNL
ncbi:MAG: zinc ribbon domain-containing protein [Prevotella sp.]|nr:zinc ribbon domain-containing protein [Prevotella sp.]